VRGLIIGKVPRPRHEAQVASLQISSSGNRSSSSTQHCPQTSLLKHHCHLDPNWGRCTKAPNYSSLNAVNYQKPLLSAAQVSSPCSPIAMNTHPNQGTDTLELQVLLLNHLARSPLPFPSLGSVLSCFLSFSDKFCYYFAICPHPILCSGCQGPKIL
jgi:hypothetical protein